MKAMAVPALAVAALVTVPAALASTPSLLVRPATVHAGQRILVSGNAGGCPSGDRVTLISRAFSARHEFAGVHAVYTRVHADGRYSTSQRIPASTPAGRYTITARCGGGNFGVAAHVRID